MKVLFDSLCQQEQELLEVALKATHRSFAPYSGFYVGAALLVKGKTKKGRSRIVRGANAENSAFGSSMCAERVAFCVAHMRGYREALLAVGIVTRTKDGPTKRDASPCGECLQVLSDCAFWGKNDDMIVLLAPTEFREGEVIERCLLRELHPYPFSPANLLNNV